MSCQLCFKNMTEEPLTHDDVNVCGLAIVQRHFIPINETFLCLADRIEHNELIDKTVNGSIKMVHCKKFVTKTNTNSAEIPFYFGMTHTIKYEIYYHKIRKILKCFIK